MKTKKIESGIIAAAILKKPHLLGKAIFEANCKRREERLKAVIEMRLAAKMARVQQ